VRKCAFLAMLALLLVVGCVGVYKPGFTKGKAGVRQASGGFALAVCGQTITSDEIIDSLIERLRPIAQVSDFEGFCEQARGELEQALADKMSYILLYQQVRKEMGERIDEALERGTEREVRRLVADFGGDHTKAEEYLKEEGMDWESFEELHKKLILIAWRLPQARPVTSSELLDCYNEIRDEFFAIEERITLRLIDIKVAKVPVTDPNRSRLEEAKGLADDLVKRIRADEDFGLLAKQNSHGYRKDSGGLWKPTQPESLAEPYDILAAEAERMQPGDIAGPIEAGGHIFIMRLEEKQTEGFKRLRQVQREVEEKIILDRRKEAAGELDARLGRQVALSEKGRFIDLCLEKIYEMSSQ